MNGTYNKNEKGLITDSLSIGYDSDLISSIHLRVQPGKIVSIIGPNGCGKSTLLKTVTGMLKSRSGVIYLDDKDKESLSLKDRAQRLSMVMTGNLSPELMTCREVIESGRYPYTGFLGKLSDEDHRIVKKSIDLCECADIADLLFTNISDGQRQRVMLARSIAQEPEVLVLDEPTSYLDIRYKTDIITKIARLAKDSNIAVLMSVHEPGIAMKVSDTVVAMGEGKILRVGSPAVVFEESFIRRLYGLGDSDIAILGEKPWMDDVATNISLEDVAVPNISLENIAATNIPFGDVAVPNISFGDVALSRPPQSSRHLMIQGTMSNVGKSLITAGLCRVFAQDGYKVAPFKSQNMANNSYVTEEGLEMGRAQVMQAECARTAPSVDMNPILLKPNDDHTSQVIVRGRPVGNMSASEYFAYKKSLIPVIKQSFDALKEKYDIIVIEGAGSPAEINLKENDIVNMGLAEMVDAPVLLAGDIDRGGVFAQLIGTLDLLAPDERARVKGLVINKFRGDIGLLKPGLSELEKKSGCKISGVIPYVHLNIDDEDSLSERFESVESKSFDIAVVRLPHISNFTDMDIFYQLRDVSVRFVSDTSKLGEPDIIVLPGTKNTVGDMNWLMSSGFSKKIAALAHTGTVIIGICGGYQMLGKEISDPEAAEDMRNVKGLGLLPVNTVMASDKTRKQFTGSVTEPAGVLSKLKDLKVSGYEIHMGITKPEVDLCEFTSNGTGYCSDNVYGTYVHGLFDNKEIAATVIECVAGRCGKSVDTTHLEDRIAEKEKQYDILAETIRNSLDIDAIYSMMGLDGKKGAAR